MARPVLRDASYCNPRFPDSTDQVDLLASRSPPSLPPLFIAQSSVGSVSNCCSAYSGCSGPLRCFDDPTRSRLGYEEELNNGFIGFWPITEETGGLDIPVGLVFDVTTVLIVAWKRSGYVWAAISEGVLASVWQQEASEKSEVRFDSRQRNWKAMVRHIEWAPHITCFLARYAGPRLTWLSHVGTDIGLLCWLRSQLSRNFGSLKKRLSKFVC